nr:hypothetical protein [Tanacetum cinerariifolium]
MSFNRKQQKELRSETYSKLAKLAEDPKSGVQLRGKKWFCRHHLPKVQEISRFVDEQNLKSEDRPDVMTRVVKIKLDIPMKDLKERYIFGHVKGGCFVVGEGIIGQDNLYGSAGGGGRKGVGCCRFVGGRFGRE